MGVINSSSGIYTVEHYATCLPRLGLTALGTEVIFKCIFPDKERSSLDGLTSNLKKNDNKSGTYKSAEGISRWAFGSSIM
jgi:hypothetical protein